MKRIAKILSYICLGAMVWGALHIAQNLPADNGRYIEKKYAGWSGVLRGWVYSDWSCSGSFISWLNGCAAEFEKAHPGVYLEFESVTRQAMTGGGIHPPEMMIFSRGTLDMEAAAIAQGGYVFVENPDAPGFAIAEEHAAPLIAMYEEERIEIPDSGIDLGLPASAAIEGIEIAGDAFQRFMNGEIGRTIVNQAQLAKLIALRDSGRGPDWQCIARGKYSWCDQQLMLGISAQDAQQRQLCEDFLALLLDEDQQAALRVIGAFPVTGISAYDSYSAYRPMEQQLLATTAIFPKSEHSRATAAGLVRKLVSGEISPEEAVEKLMQTQT